ncbi:MAG: hypothetical protein ACPG5U_06755 [Planktomarina sp.]
MLTMAPFVLLVGIAPGTMVQAGDAGIQIVLCQGDVLATVTLGEDQSTQTPLHQDATCSWAPVVVVAVVGANDVLFAGFDLRRADLVQTKPALVASIQQAHASARAPPLA